MPLDVWQYRITCREERRDFYVDLPSGSAAPTVCPTDPAHSVRVDLHDRHPPDTDYTKAHAIPTATTDESENWRRGSRILAIDGVVYECLDATTAAAIWSPRGPSGGGMSAADHQKIRQLIHFVDGGPGFGFAAGPYALEILPAGPFPLSWIWYVDAAKTTKLVELVITRNANKTPATETWKMYDTDGSTVLETVIDTIAYSGVNETGRSRVVL